MEHKKNGINDIAEFDASIKNDSSLFEGVNEFEEFLSSLYSISDSLKEKMGEQIQLLIDGEDIDKS